MRIFTLFTLLVAVLSATAQPNYTYREKFVEGNYLILEENYSLALRNFLDAYKLDSTNANINYLVGLCYLKSVSEKKKGVNYLRKSLSNISEKYSPFEVKEKSAPINAYYYLGQAYHLTYKIDSAIKYFQKYKSYLNYEKHPELLKDVNHQLEMCAYAEEYLALPTEITITNLGDSVNSPYPDYSPVITADESIIIFTSRRPGSTGGDKTLDDQYFEDIYYCWKREDGNWSSPVSIGENINTPGHEATIGLTADGYRLFIYKDDNGDGNIYMSTLEGDTWSVPEIMGSDINTTAWEPSACLTPDGNTLYFVSDRKGGYGGRDLYRCVRLPNGKWSLASNMGPTVNTEFDEDAPFIHPDRITLFFSSNGHSSMGGFDIFYTTQTDTGWTIPTNLLPPINTPDDDIFYSSSTDGKRAYFSSVGKDTRGDKDIYMATLDQGPAVGSVALILGKIIPVEGKPLPDNLEITITNLETGEVGVYKANSKSGKYVLPLMPSKSFTASYSIDGEEFFNETIDVPEGSGYKEIEKEIYLDPIKLQESLKKAMEAQEKRKKETGTGMSELERIKEEIRKNKEAKEVQDVAKKEDIKPAPAKEVEAKAYKERVYKVQISSRRKPALYDAFKLKGVREVEYRKTENGWYVYYKGTFKSYKEASKLRDEMKEKSFDDAIVVPFSGELIPFDDRDPAKSSMADNSSSLTSLTNNTFTMYFKYNVVEINSSDEDFNKFIDNLVTKFKSNGEKLNLSLVSSASHVPTRSFSSNRELASQRATSSKTKVINALKAKGLDVSKVTFDDVSSSVNGPKYNDDYLINKAQYEKYQYIKITAK